MTSKHWLYHSCWHTRWQRWTIHLRLNYNLNVINNMLILIQFGFFFNLLSLIQAFCNFSFCQLNSLWHLVHIQRNLKTFRFVSKIALKIFTSCYQYVKDVFEITFFSLSAGFRKWPSHGAWRGLNCCLSAWKDLWLRWPPTVAWSLAQSSF